MNIMIINCHSANRGDEAAVKALVDELNARIPNVNITLAIFPSTVYPSLPKNVKTVWQMSANGKKGLINYLLAILLNGKLMPNKTSKEYIDALHNADYVVHAPGGPSIGDIYYGSEPAYLRNYEIVRRYHKKYMFFAPSMGPFRQTERNKRRKKILSGAEKIVVRDPISLSYVNELLPENNVQLALDSAFQYDFDVQQNEKKLVEYTQLTDFLGKHKKCVGITITDLVWHPVYGKNEDLHSNITSTFKTFLVSLEQKGYGIVFIPQLYGTSNDFNLMSKFSKNDENYFVVSADNDNYDSYFQQYLISKLYAVVGMRYHSNIFSAKAGTPFISVSYEQKMQGFMEKMNISDYCIPIDSLSATQLENKFELLENTYDKYKNVLVSAHDRMKQESAKTMDILVEQLEKAD